jgi:hypothetical protein
LKVFVEKFESCLIGRNLSGRKSAGKTAGLQKGGGGESRETGRLVQRGISRW